MVLVVGIIDDKVLFCNDISEGNVEKKFSMIEYNNRTVYD